MVDVKELRVGNVVSVYGKPKILTLQDIRFIDSDNQNPKNKGCNAQYIPLTEEWLLKFGFEKYDDGVFCHPKTDLAFDLVKCDFYVVGQVNTYEGTVNDAFPLRTKTKYVHQLQNLYFALTNTELTVNL